MADCLSLPLYSFLLLLSHLLLLPGGTNKQEFLSSIQSNIRKQHDLLINAGFGRRWDIRWEKTGLAQGENERGQGRRQNNIRRKREKKTKVPIYSWGGWSRRLMDWWQRESEVCRIKKTEMCGSEAVKAALIFTAICYSATHKKLRFRNICGYVTRAGSWAFSCSYLPAAAAT